MSGLPTTEAELDHFLAAFENGTYPKSGWTHAAHIVAGSSYIHILGFTAALPHMRERVRAYNLAVGGQNTPTSGYHETLTHFWLLVLDMLISSESTIARLPFTQLAVQNFGHRRDLHRTFYDFDVVASTEARATWVAPTRAITLQSITLDTPQPEFL